jgi:hypothetical protein
LALALFAAVLPLCARAVETSADLARRYVELRPGVLSASRSVSPVDPEKLRQALATASQFTLAKLGSGPAWNANNPEWQRLRAIIEEDIERIMHEVANDPLIDEMARRTEEAYVNGLAARLSVDELKALVRYYSEGAGAYLVGLQPDMYDDIGFAMTAAQMELASGQRRRHIEARRDTQEAREILGLFDEWVRIQGAILDPGRSGSERSGLAVIPMMVGIAFDRNEERWKSLWRAVPEESRRAIIGQRESALGKKERAAIYETAKALKAIVQPEEQMRKFGELLGFYVKKWQALAPRN